ncbi:endonuclease III [Anaerophilus nitritogenes]|uniref:endonuclease III n=1 Tax=Anaerophilus nitritogenes TaxID=2498136 RepID=UPI00101BDDED|nr:endonuclease III [Anaerophilus nitritogenes]
MKKKSLTKKEINIVLDKLYQMYPEAVCELVFKSPFELLISTILSAQCTDIRVNKITKELYKEYNTPQAFIRLTEEELGEKIRSCGFYRMKSKNILATCRILIEEYNEEVPSNREELMKLPGVGRKTANVVMSNAFSKPAIAVDTHVFRVSNRIGLASSDNVEETEQQLMKNIEKEKWSDAHHWIIYHGRRVCKARKPLCEECLLWEECLYYKGMKR